MPRWTSKNFAVINRQHCAQHKAPVI